MTYLLDTDVLNYLLKKREPVTSRFKNVSRQGATMVLSAVVHYEINRYLTLTGAKRLSRDYRRMTARWKFAVPTVDTWDIAADLWARRHAQGRPIEDADLLIAVTAIQAGAVLVTNNVRHYDLLGVTVENWMAAGDGGAETGSV